MARAGITLNVGRLRRAPKGTLAVQSIAFDTREGWSAQRIVEWLKNEGYRARSAVDLRKLGAYLRGFEVHSRHAFATGTLHPVQPGSWERVEMNPKRKRKSKAKPKKKTTRTARAAKVTRKKSTTTSVTRTNPRGKRGRKVKSRKRTAGRMLRAIKRAAKRLRINPATRYTVAFSRAALAAFVKNLPRARRRELKGQIAKHARGGVYVKLPGWHGSRTQANALQARARMLLTYLAGRSRKPLSSGGALRVIAVP